MNNPDVSFNLKLLYDQGIEIYKKQFDTKLLSKNRQQKYNILSDNKRATPDVLGYQLRVARLSN
jgi:hypothetical protein